MVSISLMLCLGTKDILKQCCWRGRCSHSSRVPTRPIRYFEVRNLCYGRVSFRVSNDDCSARIFFLLRVGLSFERFDSVLVNLIFPWSALNSISLCCMLNHAFVFLFYARTYIFSIRRRTCERWKDIFLKSNGLKHCFLARAKLPRSAILNIFFQ